MQCPICMTAPITRFGTFTVTRDGNTHVIARGNLAFVISSYTEALDLEAAAMHIRRAIGDDAIRAHRACPKCGHDRTSNASACHYCHGAATGPESDLARCKRLNPDGCPGCPCCPETRERANRCPYCGNPAAHLYAVECSSVTP